MFLSPFRKVSVSSDKGVIAVKSCLKVLCRKNIIKHRPPILSKRAPTSIP